TVPCPRVRAGPTARESPALRNEDPSWIVNILQGPPGVKFWRERRSRDNSYQEEATCPPYRRPPTRRESDLRELTRLDHLNQDVPFILLEDSDISSFADADLVASELHFRAFATPRRAQQHFPVLQCTHLRPFTTLSRSM